MDTHTAAGADSALKLFELDNNIVPLSQSDEAIYCFDEDYQRQQADNAPWKKDVHHFRKVEISSVALVKMVMHARSGGDIEVMGLMLGKVVGNTMIVLDAFALPVEGSETRVNAQSESYEYMTQYLERSQAAGQKEPVIGWYHSHPGYGCWLSGIDVATQMLNQQFQDPFLAVVIDPKRTMSAGKVDLGAFRTFPEEHTAGSGSGAGSDGFQNVPLSKIEDFGVHSDKYYPLDVSYFKSTLDQRLMERLWRKHWVNTLSQSPLITNSAFTTQMVNEIAEKINMFSRDSKKGVSYSQILRESDAIAEEITQGHKSHELKKKLFSHA
ncbi:COP9 signalosome catalytic subunit rri1 [Coemansia sp. RSA 2706]|nr:COP9 signalosome catalytic subunit rri1 [Coemansia sp. RSA 2711]KAJ1849280.1 COP9 signalosome catalytic subunit rri1 [Coemansia sp. RSA 2708]KAJ2299137.1 COP9 signalosome catalytic subunit rri1 [Coemansia sp. RSA 2706]KAJ2311303.1 COP9 signalosome catalytic subunit rri1 [Coemansia sp. RSA 2705]KAJ2318763.1 COP9 signalosome catalytic subunit rri1 [Coemansia sp. RSA 2704]KAJ2323426.1 COP9 signalosome catalytic subunit rri1 [Coemansia sp. RSA 2702]KAJ2366950.1 COP9 signalosome catalytic subun